MTKPSAPTPKGRVPVALRAPILQNLTNDDAPMLRSTPPVSTASTLCSVSSSTAASTAAKLLAQAASVMKFGPRRLRMLATRPETMLASSPGMESSVMVGKVRSITAWNCSINANCVLDGSRWNSGAARSQLAYSGKAMRCVVM